MSQNSPRFEQFAADRLHAEREQIARDWVDQLASRLGVRRRHALARAVRWRS
jgi:hypothetical protein